MAKDVNDPKVGEEAPDFTLKSHLDTEVKLSDFRGKKNVVMAFYPLAFTPVWTVQIPAYEEDLSEFARYNAQVLGLSTDTIPSIKAWAKSLGNISYPLLSDFWPHGLTALKYGVLRAEGFTERAIFIVDKKGIIRYIDIHPIGDQPKNTVLFEELEKIEG
jgi:peroxiredoxin